MGLLKACRPLWAIPEGDPSFRIFVRDEMTLRPLWMHARQRAGFARTIQQEVI
jgi:hypothetical protein